MLDLTDADLKQSRFYQEVFTEGEQEGLLKGRQEGEVNLVLRQLQRRCGPLPSAVHEHIVRLDLPRLEALGEALLEFRGIVLEALGEALLEFRGIVEVEQWLAAHGQPEAQS